eukprot:RCo001376
MGNCRSRVKVVSTAGVAYTESDSDSNSPPAHPVKAPVHHLRDAAVLPGSPQHGPGKHPATPPRGGLSGQPAKRLQVLLSGMLGLSTEPGDVAEAALQDDEVGLQDVPRTSPRSGMTLRTKSRHISVVGYDHILSDAKALAAAKAIPEPIDPRSAWLRPFQPNCLREQVLTIGKDCTQVEGAIAFVDISGFSALTHTLGQGAKGAMLLSKYINDYLTPLIEIVDQHQGDIVSFAGDAFLALWPFRPTTDTQKAPLAKATACSLALQAKYSRYTVPGTTIVLKIHIGVAYGSCLG